MRMRLVGATHFADLRGPTACELMLPGEVRALLARLGDGACDRGVWMSTDWLGATEGGEKFGSLPSSVVSHPPPDQ